MANWDGFWAWETEDLLAFFRMAGSLAIGFREPRFQHRGLGAATQISTIDGAMPLDAPLVDTDIPEAAESPKIALAAGTPTPSTSTNINVTHSGRPQNETSIALDPLNHSNLVAGTNDWRFLCAEAPDSLCVDAGVAYSLNGGMTWTATTLASLSPALAKYCGQGDPAVAAYKNGIFYYSFFDFPCAGIRGKNRIAVATTDDGGQTWTLAGVVVDPGAIPSQIYTYEDKPFMTVDNTGGLHDGNLYVTWHRFDVVPGGSCSEAIPIMFSRSINGGQTFELPQTISDNTCSQFGPIPVVGPNGEVYVAWRSFDATISTFQILFDKSDGGIAWGNDIVVATIDPLPALPGATFRVPTFPSMAVDRSGGPHHGNIYIAWQDESGLTGTSPDVLVSRSTDGGGRCPMLC